MITSSDRAYKQTKRIKLGLATIKQEFRELAEWIDETYHVHTLNIYYDTMENGKRPRIEVCVEFESDKRKLRGRSWYNYDREKQNAIAEKFKLTLHEKKTKRAYLTENVHVIYGAFEEIAKEETIQNIPKEKIVKLKKSIDSNVLWEISCFFSSVTFFVFTDEQLKKYKDSEVRKKWTNQFFDILEPYNEFGYFKRKKFSVFLDSKENFDNKYDSNWHYYYH